MTRPSARQSAVGLALVLLANPALFADTVSFVNGDESRQTTLTSVADGRAILRTPNGDWNVPVANLATARLSESTPESAAGSRNLYLHNGDKLDGTITGEGETVRLDSAHVKGLTAPLDSVKAVRFGRLLGTQAKFEDAFQELLAKNRHAVLMRRGDKPFPLEARVLALTGKTVRVLLGETPRDVDAQKVYGFVRAKEDTAPAADVVRARAFLVDGGRVTIPLESMDKAELRGGGATIAREAVLRIEIERPLAKRLSELEPINVEEVSLFGKPRPWRRNEMVIGGALRMRGKTYTSGLGVHTRSRIEFVLGGRWKLFFVRCGIDDAAGDEGAAVFRVHRDNEPEPRSAKLTRSDRPVTMRIDVTGVDRLVLEVLPGGSYTSDFCDWADARLSNPEKMDPPPTNQK